jgi:hypothetical protein
LTRQTHPACVRLRPFQVESLPAALSTKGWKSIFFNLLGVRGRPMYFMGKEARASGRFARTASRSMLSQLIGVTLVFRRLVCRPVVTKPLKLIPYYCLNHSSWPLSNNTEVTCRLCRVKPGKSLTSQDRQLYIKLTRRRV